MATTAALNVDYGAPSTKRVSYILPAVQHAPRFFELPSLEANVGSARGRSGPLLASLEPDTHRTLTRSHIGNKRASGEHGGASSSSSSPHPRHNLPVSSLAIDTSTVLQDNRNGTPSGILYTGGRDGMIGAWELGLRMKKRKVVGGLGMEEEEGEVEEERDEFHDGLLDEQSQPARSEWEVEDESEGDILVPAAKFRQCIGSHTDWINDIILCNRNQTVISASSDRSVKIWNPHDPTSSMVPQTLGTHKDYVRALTHAPAANWVASGSFDQTIKVWDIKEMRSEAVLTIGEPSLRSSIYGLAANDWGSVIAAASPEKTVRLWDPRSGQQISQLVGHTDNVRSVIVSQDGSHLLSASSDSTIRLWSLAEQRCLHTFTHHSDSVWSLFSNHPSLDIFYSGDRSGVVCKVDWERCNEVAEGECVVLAKEKTRKGGVNFQQGSMQDSKAAGIYKVVAADNAYFWTASSNSAVSRWKDVPARSKREALYPIGRSSRPYANGGKGKGEQQEQARSTPPLASPSAHPFRPSALKGHPNSTNAATSNVSFAAQVDLTSPHSSSFEAPASGSERWEGRGEQAAATLYGLPFDSLVCLAPVNDPYGAAIGLGSISVRTLDRRESTGGHANTMFSSASLISIPSVLRAPVPSHSAGLDGSPTAPHFNAHLASAANHHLDGARPSSTRSASIRFAPVRSHHKHHSSDEAPGSLIEHQNALAAEEEEEEDGDGAGLEARQAFEERESANEARALRQAPEDIVFGAHGLIRSSMLNDRRHVLTIDSAGHIFLWDVLAGHCLGAFDWYQVEEAWSKTNGKESLLLPGDALDLVKERIQGEGATPIWCAVDTKIGSLSVHFDFPRCFDAEIYLDEMEDALDGSKSSFSCDKDDMRINMAKVVLRNLFDGFIHQEASLRGGPEAAKVGKEALAVARLRDDFPVNGTRPELTLELGGKRSHSQRSDGAPVHTPGMTIALAVPAKTPAVLPVSSPLTPKSGASETSGLQQLLLSSPDRNTASEDQSNQTTGTGDYFSLQRSGGEAKGAAVQAKGAPLYSPSSPGGSSLMGRLRMSMKRGDQSKKEEKNSALPARALGSAASNGVGEGEQPVVNSSSLATRRHLEAVRNVMVKAEPNRLLDEIPTLAFPAQTAIMISESSPDSANFHFDDYRGLVESTGNDVAPLELASPLWLLELLMGVGDNAPLLKDKDKLTFLLVPWEEVPMGKQQGEQVQSPTSALETMPAMPTGNSRLTATRMLRMKKAAAYVADKLNIHEELLPQPGSRSNSIVASRRSSASTTEPMANGALHHPFLSMTSVGPVTPASTSTPTSTTGKVEASELIEILCNGTILSPQCTLAQVQRFYWKSSNVIRLDYRWRH